MERDRRAFLAAVGTAAVGGCLGDSTDSAPTDSTSSEETRPVDATDSSDDRTATDDGDSSDARERRETTIGFGGDTMVGRRLNRIYGREDVDPATVWGDLRPRLESLDGVCCNLECCLSKRGDPFPDRAYYFRGDPEWAVPALGAGNVRFAALANNHAMDFGAVALTDTIDVLGENGIEVAGAGETPAAARAPATFSVGDVDVAVVSFTDRAEVYGATDGRPGTAYAEADPENPETRRVSGGRSSARSRRIRIYSSRQSTGERTGSSVPAIGSSRSATGSSIGASISFTATALTSFRRSKSTATVSFSTTPATSSTISASKASWATTRATSSKSRSKAGILKRYGSFPSVSTTASRAPARTRRPGSERRCAIAPHRSRRRTSGMATVSSFTSPCFFVFHDRDAE